MNIAPRLRVLLWVLVLLAGWPLAVSANGGVILETEDSGPFQIAVFAESSPLRSGMDNAISVLVVQRGTSNIVLNAEVTVQVEALPAAGEPRSYAATHENADNKLYYDAIVAFPTQGRWQIAVSVRGQEGEGTVTVEVPVEAPRPTNRVGTTALLGIPLLLMVVIVLVLTRKGGDKGGERKR